MTRSYEVLYNISKVSLLLRMRQRKSLNHLLKLLKYQSKYEKKTLKTVHKMYSVQQEKMGIGGTEFLRGKGGRDSRGRRSLYAGPSASQDAPPLAAAMER